MRKYPFTLSGFDRWLSAVGYKDIVAICMDNAFVDHFLSMLGWDDFNKYSGYSDRGAAWRCEGRNIPIYRVVGLDPKMAVAVRKNGTCVQRGFEYAGT